MKIGTIFNVIARPTIARFRKEQVALVLISGKFTGFNMKGRKRAGDYCRLVAYRIEPHPTYCLRLRWRYHSGSGHIIKGRRVTTHWRLLDELQRPYPDTIVEHSSIYVQDGSIWISAGVSSGFDFTLAMVEDDYGCTLTRKVRRNGAVKCRSGVARANPYFCQIRRLVRQ